MGSISGAMFGPIACATVGQTGSPADFKWAFLVAGVGMLISLIIQKIYHDKYVLSPEGKVLATLRHRCDRRKCNKQRIQHKLNRHPKYG
jgi:POT family proton-dependent oligopeptide transporter